MEEKNELTADELFSKLSEKLPAEGVQRTKGSATKKNYDTDGYGYQYCVNRLNEIYGTHWGFDYKIIKEIEGTYRSGQKNWEIVVEVGIWLKSEDIRKCVGGHIGASYTDALKGAITNAFKKTAAFWGVGRHAYEGTIDEDNLPYPQSQAEQKKEKSLPQEKPNGDLKKALEYISTIKSQEEIQKAQELIDKRTWEDQELKTLIEALVAKSKEITTKELGGGNE